MSNADASSIPVGALIGDAVVRIGADASLSQVADLLVDRAVGAVVVGQGDRPAGIVSERDLVQAISQRRDPGTTTAMDVAHTKLIWCDDSATVAEVAGEMMEQYVRHVLVETDGRLVGVVSARDLLGVYAADDGFD